MIVLTSYHYLGFLKNTIGYNYSRQPRLYIIWNCRYVLQGMPTKECIEMSLKIVVNVGQHKEGLLDIKTIKSITYVLRDSIVLTK